MIGRNAGVLRTAKDRCWLTVPAGSVVVMASRGKSLQILSPPPGRFEVDTPVAPADVFPILALVMPAPLAAALLRTRQAWATVFEVFAEAGWLDDWPHEHAPRMH